MVIIVLSSFDRDSSGALDDIAMMNSHTRAIEEEGHKRITVSPEHATDQQVKSNMSCMYNKITTGKNKEVMTDKERREGRK